MGQDGRMYAVKTLKNGYEITDPNGEKSYLVYNKKEKSWNYKDNGALKELFRFNDDGTIRATLPGGKKMDVTQNEPVSTSFAQPYTRVSISQQDSTGSSDKRPHIGLKQGRTDRSRAREQKESERKTPPAGERLPAGGVGVLRRGWRGRRGGRPGTSPICRGSA